MAFLRKATPYHTEGRFIGYQGSKDKVEPQIKAIFDALKQEASLTYVNSVVGFSPDQGTFTQRIRLPRESLTDGQANCIDGTVLIASLLEAISLNPAIVVIPGHAFLAWETWRGSDAWRYLETTMIGTNTFEEACQSAEKTAKAYQELVAKTGKLHFFRRWSLRELRTKHYIFPME
jgi:hypothetical protein